MRARRQVLRDFWYVARAVGEAGVAGQRVVAFPQWAEAASDPRKFQAVLNHIGICSETCEYLGESLMCSGRHPQAQADDEPAAPYPMLLLRSFTKPESLPDGMDADELPWFYSDDDDDDPIGNLGLESDEPVGPPANDEEVLRATYEWVDAVIVHMKVCPFSSSTFKAGMPIGTVGYPLSRATTTEELYQAFWQEVENLRLVDERELATVLLVAPEFALHSAGGFDAFSDTLNNALSTLGFEEHIQLVFFHPDYTFRDGQNRFGSESEGSAANFARRSPYPMVNLLRTPQAAAHPPLPYPSRSPACTLTARALRPPSSTRCPGARALPPAHAREVPRSAPTARRRCGPHKRACRLVRCTRPTRATWRASGLPSCRTCLRDESGVASTMASSRSTTSTS